MSKDPTDYIGDFDDAKTTRKYTDLTNKSLTDSILVIASRKIKEARDLGYYEVDIALPSTYAVRAADKLNLLKDKGYNVSYNGNVATIDWY